jgi:hypothetical protein
MTMMSTVNSYDKILIQQRFLNRLNRLGTEVNQIAKLSWPPNKKIHKRIIGG